MNDLERRLAALSPEQRELLMQRLKAKGVLVAPEAVQTATRSNQAIVPFPRTGVLPLSFAQQRLWFLHQLEPSSAAYQGRWMFQLSGTVDESALVASLTTIMQRHEILRTTFSVHAGQPQQEIAPEI